MTQAIRDENRIPTILGASDADGTTPLPVYAIAATNSMKVNNGVGGSDLSDNIDIRDENRVVAFMAVSAVDGVTPVPIYVDAATNSLLVRST